jgi:hypothetical protein
MSTLVIAGFYIFLFLGYKLRFYRWLEYPIYASIGSIPNHYPNFENRFSLRLIEQQQLYMKHIQESIPRGRSALSAMPYGYVIDFRRNSVDIADFPGMASPPPGLPLNKSTEIQLRFLREHNIDYLIYSKFPYPCPNLSWSEFMVQYGTSPGWKHLLGLAGASHNLRNHKVAMLFRNMVSSSYDVHNYQPWAQLEFYVQCQEYQHLGEMAAQNPQVYDDGQIIVARIR